MKTPDPLSAGLAVTYRQCFMPGDRNSRISGGNSFAIVLISSGAIRIRIDNAPKDLEKGQLVILPYLPSIEAGAINGNSHLSIITFTAGFITENSIISPPVGFFDFYYSTAPTITLTEDETSELLASIQMLESKNGMSPDNIFKRELLLFSFNTVLYEVAALYYKYSHSITLRRSRKEKLTLRFLQIMENHFREQHSVKFYADALLVTSEHLSKTLRSVTGKTAKEHLEHRLVLEAKVLLQNNDLTLWVIVEELHLGNPSFFSNFFKKHTRLSPTEYRQRVNLTI